MTKSYFTFLTISFLCCAVNTTNAFEVYSAQGVAGGRLDLFLRGFVDENIYGVPGAAVNNVTAKFNWGASSDGQFQSFDFAFSGGAYIQSRTYTTGPGQTKTITATVNVNPFTVSAFGFNKFVLTPGLNGLYSAQGVDFGTFNALPLSGNVVIAGPSQSVTVPFSVMIPSDSNINFPYLYNVDTSHYPTTLSLDLNHSPYDGGGVSISYWFTPNVLPVTLANATVDGISVLIGTAGGYASSGTYSSGYSGFDLHPVPEPTTSLLMLLGFGGILFQRKNFRMKIDPR